MRVYFDEIDWDDDALLIHGGAPFTGEVVEQTPNDEIIAVTGYTDGYENGPSMEWYPTGEPKARGATRFGRAIGVHQAWYQNGQLATERTFDDQGHLLSIREWDEAGNVLKDSEYQ